MSAIASHLVSVCRFLVGAACLVLLASCTTPTRPVDEGAYTRDEILSRSAEAELDRATRAESPQRDLHLMEAADLFLRAHRPADAEKVLKRVNPAGLQVQQLARYSLLYAGLALENDRYFLARELLGNAQLELHRGEMTPDQRRQWHRLRGDLFSLLGDEINSIPEYTALSAQLKDRGELLEVHDRIWQTLARLPASTLEKEGKVTGDSVVAGWYQLARLARGTQGNIDRQVQLLGAWRSDHPTHPAAQVPPTSLQRAEAATANLPRSLAVLLPFSGDYAQAAEALRDGFLSAYYQVAKGQGRLPDIRFYDTDTMDITTLYSRAVAEGAELVIGPLRKEQLQELILQPQLAVPVLGLNYAEDVANNHANLYQFGLSIADEARQAADRAWVEGHRSALVLTPNTTLGNSAREAFASRWQQKGGTLIQVPPYSPGALDFSPLLKAPLLVDQSEERAKRLERTLGKDLSFTPRRRRDVDAIFLTAYPQQGRQIKPTLDFLYAGDLPVYATSQIYGGSANPGQDRDLDGIRFCAMPWTIPGLTNEAGEPGGSLAPAYRNLFAMGIDSYRLHQWLPLMQAMPETQLNGHTGGLSMDGGNRIVRTLPWARFSKGRVVATRPPGS